MGFSPRDIRCPTTLADDDGKALNMVPTSFHYSKGGHDALVHLDGRVEGKVAGGRAVSGCALTRLLLKPLHAGLLLGAQAMIPSTAAPLCLYASTHVDTFFVPNAELQSHHRAHLVLLSLALMSASFELSQAQRKIIQLRQHYAIPTFDTSLGGSLLRCSPSTLSLWDPLRWGYLVTNEDGMEHAGMAPLASRRKPLYNRSTRIHRGAHAKLISQMVRI